MQHGDERLQIDVGGHKTLAIFLPEKSSFECTEFLRFLLIEEKAVKKFQKKLG